ncbi:MAG: glycine--tRNA ligase subunit beta, partial [Deltaproteobacteria bacterium]
MAMKEFIFEIGTEEIPAGFMPPALSSLKSIAAEALQAARIEHGEIETSGTPRRMVLVIRELSDRQPDITEETMGPSVNVAFDADGNPTKAGMGFARSRGVEVGDLLRVTTDKGEYIAVKQTIKGRPTKELLKEELPRWLSKLPFRKSMRWGSGEVAFVRPIHWLLALFGGEIIEFEYAGANSGNISRGHRFHAPASFEVAGVEDYFKKISEASVIIDPAVRKEMIREQVAAEAAKVGGKVLEDEDLLNTVNFLLELPTAVSGTFEEHYLELPRELLILTMKTHQKYFAVVDDAGNLMNYFITVSNTRARDMSVVAKGNERVLRARLSDASFFFVEDQKKPLEEHLEGLKKVVFQSKLGTSYEKVERFTANATSLAGSICPGSEATVGR